LNNALKVRRDWPRKTLLPAAVANAAVADQHDPIIQEVTPYSDLIAAMIATNPRLSPTILRMVPAHGRASRIPGHPQIATS
jgi:hypothetical protein